jgi:predicted restriction endonuclease
VFDPVDLEDGRKRTLASIVRRQGQSQFRTQLLALYAGRCVVSGCAVDAALEAAHIIPYLGPKTDHPTNGLTLRADIHTLFDLGLIAVDSKTMTVLVSPSLDGTEYESYRGKALRLPAKKQGRPSPEALDQHRKESGL